MALSHLDSTGVGRVIERLRFNFEAERFDFAPSLGITASFGVAGLERDGETELSGLLSRADAALYRAKQQGRNRIEFVEDSSSTCLDLPKGDQNKMALTALRSCSG